MGKTFKDQKRYDRKKQDRERKQVRLPRVEIDWNTGTRVHPDDKRRTRDKGWQDDWQQDGDI